MTFKGVQRREPAVATCIEPIGKLRHRVSNRDVGRGRYGIHAEQVRLVGETGQLSTMCPSASGLPVAKRLYCVSKSITSKGAAGRRVDVHRDRPVAKRIESEPL